jgi:hypothetical protein
LDQAQTFLDQHLPLKSMMAMKIAFLLLDGQVTTLLPSSRFGTVKIGAYLTLP